MNGYTGECTICGEELPDADDKPCDRCQKELDRATKKLVDLALRMPTKHTAEAVKLLEAVMEKISIDEIVKDRTKDLTVDIKFIETEKWK